MKKQFLISLAIFSSIFTVNAQWNGTNPISTDASVGIGTSSVTSPLTISKSTWNLVPTVEIKHIPENAGCNGCLNVAQKISVLDDQGANKSNIGLWINAKNALNNYAAVFENGNVGIGTTTPVAKLHINNGANTDAAVLATSTENNKLIVSSGVTQPANTSTFRITQEFENNRNNGYISFHRGSSVDGGFLTFGSSGEEKLRIDPNGNIGVGILNPLFKLDVCGTIRAREVKVDLGATCVPDFVFKKDYKLMTLNELEKFVTTQQHLPEIAPEKEMIENGLNVKEFQMKLLQKMEEMTLYIIEQNKKNENQEQELKILKAKIKKLESHKK
ncbi:hypothetical protein [Flavobacterium sp.]|uniref:hypothetical protein n=1 Tax=Flavobacterium sp. TaxID=239 RepID=UPI0025BEA0D4|nr:hypothetical protein [Flavobacterium sp.]